MSNDIVWPVSILLKIKRGSGPPPVGAPYEEFTWCDVSHVSTSLEKRRILFDVEFYNGWIANYQRFRIRIVKVDDNDNPIELIRQSDLSLAPLESKILIYSVPIKDTYTRFKLTGWIGKDIPSTTPTSPVSDPWFNPESRIFTVSQPKPMALYSISSRIRKMLERIFGLTPY
ncbi:hypothetical protein ACFLY8_04290 [Halobacteriota archaeon]